MAKKVFSGIPDGRKYYVVGGKTKKKAYENMREARAFRWSYSSFSKYMSDSSDKSFEHCEPYEDVVFLVHDWCTNKERYERIWPK
jgi:hypothetical protein